MRVHRLLADIPVQLCGAAILYQGFLTFQNKQKPQLVTDLGHC